MSDWPVLVSQVIASGRSQHGMATVLSTKLDVTVASMVPPGGDDGEVEGAGARGRVLVQTAADRAARAACQRGATRNSVPWSKTSACPRPPVSK